MKKFNFQRLQKVLVLCIIISLLVSGTVVQAAQKDYTDIGGHKYEDALQYSVNHGLLTSNTKKINANSYITRGAVLKAVNTLLGAKELYEHMDSVTNLKEGDSYYKTVSIALNAGYITVSKKNTVLNPLVKADQHYIATVLSKVFQVPKSEIMANNKSYNKMTRGEFAEILMKYAPNIINESTSKIVDGNVVINQPDVILSDTVVKGDLIIGDGVGTGEVELFNVTVEGKVFVRGGGANSVKIYGNSSVSTIVVKQVNNKVSIKVSGDASVSLVYINDGCDDVVIIGNVGTLDIAGNNLNVETKDGTINSVNVNGYNTQLSIDESSSIDTLQVNRNATSAQLSVSGSVKAVETNAANFSMEVNDNAVVNSFVSNSNNTNVSGTGELKNAELNGSGSSVSTQNTIVTNGENTNVTGTQTPSTTPAPGVTETPTNTPTPTVSPTPTPDPSTPIYTTDERFETGYPMINLATNDEGTKVIRITYKLKEGVASEESPVSVFFAGSYYNVNFQVDSESIIHGHFGITDSFTNGDVYHNLVSTSHSNVTSIVDSSEHELTFNMYSSNEGYAAYFVIKTNEKTSEVPTKVEFTSDTTSSFSDNQAPYVGASYISEATVNVDKETRLIRVYCGEQLSETHLVTGSNFTVSGAAIDVNITDIKIHSSTQHYANWIDLTLEYPKGSSIDDLTILYHKPETGGFSDIANVPNQIDDFGLYMKTMDYIEGVYRYIRLKNVAAVIQENTIKVSADGKYAHIELSGIPFYLNAVTPSDYEIYINDVLWNYRGLSYSQDYIRFFVENQEAELANTYNVKICIKNKDSYINMLGKESVLPIEIFNVTCKVDYREFQDAVYSKSAQTLTFRSSIGNYENGCLFVLNIDGVDYRLRGEVKSDQWMKKLDSQGLYGLVEKLNSATSVQLTYNPITTTDTLSYGTNDSGRPIERLTIPVSITD